MECQQVGFQGAKSKMESREKQSACVNALVSAACHDKIIETSHGHSAERTSDAQRTTTHFGFLYSFSNNINLSVPAAKSSKNTHQRALQCHKVGYRSTLCMAVRSAKDLSKSAQKMLT
jgi:hypothetical protein